MSCIIRCTTSEVEIVGHSDWIEGCIKVSALSHFMGVALGYNVKYNSKNGHTMIVLLGKEEWERRLFFVYQNELRKLAERYHDIVFEKG